MICSVCQTYNSIFCYYHFLKDFFVPLNLTEHKNTSNVHGAVIGTITLPLSSQHFKKIKDAK